MFSNPFQVAFPGVYRLDCLAWLCNLPVDTLQFSSIEASDTNLAIIPRSSKRHQMSSGSAPQPPSSASSFSWFSGDGSFCGASVSDHLKMDVASSEFTWHGPALRGSGNMF